MNSPGEKNNGDQLNDARSGPSGIDTTLTFDSVASHDEKNGGGCSTPDDVEEPSSLSARKVVDSTFDIVYHDVDSTAQQPQWYDHVSHVTYISVFGVFGTVVRIYLGRFFGLDCGAGDHSNQDFFSRLSDRICVTTNGKTTQTGGALFTDLPANMLGSFFMGLISPIVTGHPLVWFREDHPLQQHTAFHTALSVGFCGCLTTFASWNTQMVVMLDGSDTDLGPQVAAALFGYIIGVCGAVSSFLCGRHVYDLWRTIHPIPEPESLDVAVSNGSEDMEPGAVSNGSEDTAQDQGSVSKCRPTSRYASRKLWEVFLLSIGLQVAPFVLFAGLTAAFVVGDVVEDSLFYRKMWMCVILSPLGAMLRWYLAKYNSSPGPWPRLEWVPWGTLTANLSAVVISVLAEALEDRYAIPGAPGYGWIASVLPAVETGFAGSLSTVSTVVREMVDMDTHAQRYLYCFGSLTIAMLLGLLFYSPLIRH